MKEYVINKTLNYIYTHNEYSDLEKDMIKYGISNLYLQITKMIVITTIAVIFKILIPYLLFILFYNIIRSTSFGIHAKKSYQCWISSIIIFICIPYLCQILMIKNIYKIIILSISIIYISIYSPADTEKKPIISSKRRLFYKYFSTIISIIYSFIAIYINDQTISNLILFSLALQCVIISPFTYKIFGQPYDNYKKYLEKEA